MTEVVSDLVVAAGNSLFATGISLDFFCEMLSFLSPIASTKSFKETTPSWSKSSWERNATTFGSSSGTPSNLFSPTLRQGIVYYWVICAPTRKVKASAPNIYLPRSQRYLGLQICRHRSWGTKTRHTWSSPWSWACCPDIWQSPSRRHLLLVSEAFPCVVRPHS